MADSSVKSQKKNKRKLNSAGGEVKRRKTPRIGPSEDGVVRYEACESSELGGTNLKLEEELPWRNLQLILSLQNKEIELQKKVVLAFEYVGLREKERGSDIDEDHETVKTSRVIVFLNDWIQSLLVSPEKKVKVEGDFQACLDSRCWLVFKFCLEESLKLHVSLNFSRNLLRAIGCIARKAVSLLNEALPPIGEEELKLYRVVLACVSLLFSSQTGLSNENLDLWVSTIVSVTELVHKIYTQNLVDSNVGDFSLDFACLVFEPFTKFLKAHPVRKNGFQDFVDKLLEPLLHLLSFLHSRIDDNNPGRTRNLQKQVGEVLSHGLFHSTHIDGFLGLRSLDKYAGSDDGEVGNVKVAIKSYHRHLFDKLETMVAEKKVLALDRIGELFSLFVDRVKTQKGPPSLSEGVKVRRKNGSSKGLGGDLSSQMTDSNNLNAETRKSVLDFFVQIFEPFLFKIDEYLQPNMPGGSSLLDVNCTLKPINSLLASFVRERIYIRTEDISDGSCFSFLKKVYDTLFSFASKARCMPEFQIDVGMQKVFPSLAKELSVAIGYILDIEYEVSGNDLVGLWLMMLSFLMTGLFFMDPQDQSLLTSPILDLGCQLINLYSALRQVSGCIFSLCKAVRLVISSQPSDSKVHSTGCSSSKMNSSNGGSVKFVEVMLSSQEFKLAIHQAIKSIPEGQASDCIQQLTADVSESVEWMKNGCAAADEKEYGRLDAENCEVLDFCVQAEFLGTILSEIYMLMLDSLIVTSGNSGTLGLSVKELMTTIQPCISSLAGLKPDGMIEFLSSVSGRVPDMIAANRKKYIISFYWTSVFFFRLYISCRSLYRQVVSLTPPASSRKMAATVGDEFMVYTGRDWMEKDLIDKGYFSWIHDSSPSLVVLLHCISDIYFEDEIGNCCPLIYVLNAMALQRLVDLNRHIKSLQYLLQHNDNLIQVEKHDDAGLSKKGRKLKKFISVFKEEAEGLTNFMLGFISLVAKGQPLISSSHDSSYENDVWDLDVCTLNEKSLPSAVWWLICQNIDIWCPHAATKKLKKFLTLLLQTSLSCLSGSFMEQHQDVDKAVWMKKIGVQQISVELLKDSSLYEHKFVCRNFASRFCRVLESCALPLFNHSSVENVGFDVSPDWQEVFSFLSNSSAAAVSSKRNVNYGSAIESISCSSDTTVSKDENSFLAGCAFKDCHGLLNFLCWMPKEYLSSKSFSLLATYILNLERFLVASLLECHGASSGYHELLQLFVACRRTLKNIIMTSCKKKAETSISLLLPVVAESSLFTSWLFKSVSVVAELLVSPSGDCVSEIQLLIFSLADHTSYIVLTMSKHQFGHAALLYTNSKRLSKEQSSSSIVKKNSIDERISPVDYSEERETLKNLFNVAESLKEEAESLHNSLKGALCNEKVRVVDNVEEINKSCLIISCIGGFLWGLASAVDQIVEKGSEHKTKFLSRKCRPFLKLSLWVDIFSGIVSDFLQLMFVKVNQQSNSYSGAESSDGLDCNKASSDIDDNMGDIPVYKKTTPLENANCSDDVDSIELHCLKKDILQDFFRGKHPETAIFLRQLLISSSAILRLNLFVKNTTLSSRVVPISTGLSQFLLLELGSSLEIPQSFTFIWLDGVLKYVEGLEGVLTANNSESHGAEYNKLIELHLKLIGKCISLQGRRATLESHERESNTKIIHGSTGYSESFLSREQQCMDEFKARLRMSFKVLIKKPPESLLLSAVDSIKRALVGVQRTCTSIYEINIRTSNGGQVSSDLVGGIDCLDLVLEYASGIYHSKEVKPHMPNLVAALFNIILHLQSPSIFFGKCVGNDSDNNTDPGSVVLMSVEVLTRVSGKHALFQMDSWHIGQCLRIPGALFHDFCQLRYSEGPESNNHSLPLDKQSNAPVASRNSLDQQFAVNLFAVCCRLLYTVVKHRKRECKGSIAVLEASVSALLHCLETVDALLLGKRGYLPWGVEERLKCASFLRRIYEEIRQQKDVFAKHSFKFLSTYISIYSGYGPLKSGIQREIDEALRPGVYALIDACSADDLQYLHTVFGEGPRRNTLASLQHDYKLNFQYAGKV